MKYLAMRAGWPGMRFDGGDIPKPVHLPVDFDGPICANCTHVGISKGDDLPANGHDWLCMAGKRETLAPAEMNPITGKVHEARYGRRARCTDRNEAGDCEDFDRKQRP